MFDNYMVGFGLLRIARTEKQIRTRLWNLSRKMGQDRIRERIRG